MRGIAGGVGLANNYEFEDDAQRAIDEVFVGDLKDGLLCGLTKLVKESEKLIMCFRGTYINVYYRGRNVFKISKKQKYAYKIEFDFNYSKKSEDNHENKLIEMGFVLSKGNCLTKNIYGNEKLSFEFWEETAFIFIQFIDEFLEKHEGHKKLSISEKERQQEIFAENMNKSFFVFDMEYDQARKQNKDIDDGKGVRKSGRFDMLALRKNIDNNKYMLNFIELKSKKDACDKGSSDIVKHCDDLVNYKSNVDLMNSRRKDAIKMVQVYSRLGLMDEDFDTNIEIDGEVEIVFIFTDEAKEWYLLNKDTKVPKHRAVEKEKDDKHIWIKMN